MLWSEGRNSPAPFTRHAIGFRARCHQHYRKKYVSKAQLFRLTNMTLNRLLLAVFKFRLSPTLALAENAGRVILGCAGDESFSPLLKVCFFVPADVTCASALLLLCPAPRLLMR
jgi:hypothetical protein